MVEPDALNENGPRIPHDTMRDAAQQVHTEPRWPVALTILIVLVLLNILPARVRVFPAWVPYVVAIVMSVPMVALSLGTAKPRWLVIENIVTMLFLAIGGFGIVDELRTLFFEMIHHSAELTGVQLLASSIAVWVSNLLAFSIVYWKTDRGGPEARANQASKKPDFLFPHESAGDDVRADWRPTFIDYLFLSYCTATAFSPAEAQPLTSRGMLLLMLESLISLVTIIAIAARAINILGS